MIITRAVPDIRSTDPARSRAFYIDLLGFDVCMEQGDMLLFCSPSHTWVQVSLNGDGVALPPGFFVDVGAPDSVSALHEAAGDYQIIEPVADMAWGIRRFSVLDPSGTRVTVLAHTDERPREDQEDPTHATQIVRAIPTVRTRELNECRDFYTAFLGFDVCMDMHDMLMFCSPSHPRVQVVATNALAHPPGFDLDVGNVGRVHDIFERAQRAGVTVIAPPRTQADAVLTCNLLDPNGVGLNVLAHLAEQHQTPAPGLTSV